MKQLNYQTGQQGEAMAANFLAKKGYKITERNFHTRFGEIDLIAVTPRTPRQKRGRVAGCSEAKAMTPPRCYKESKLVFIEVKTKTDDRFGTPAEMITPAKIHQIKKMATLYLQSHPQIKQKYSSYRLDAVTINLQTNKIKHYQNIGSE